MTYVIVRQSTLDYLLRIASGTALAVGDVRKSLSSSPPSGTADTMRKLLDVAVLNLDAIKHEVRECVVAEATCQQCGNPETSSVAGALEIVSDVPPTSSKAVNLLRCYGCRVEVEAEADATRKSDERDARAAIGSGR